MTQEQHVAPHAPQETAPDTRQVQSLGRTVAESAEIHPADIVDVRAAVDSPVVYAAARMGAYPDNGKRTLEITSEGEEAASTAIAYAQELFPATTFSYLGQGRYGVVLADAEGRAYKVYRNPYNYSHYEKEAGAMQLLYKAGLAPKPHLLVDAAPERRYDVYAWKRDKQMRKGFEDIEIPRQDGEHDLPVLVMDEVDPAPLQHAEPTAWARGYCKAAELFLRENIICTDTEVVLNKRSGELIVMDPGELYQMSVADHIAEEEAYGGLSEDDFGHAPVYTQAKHEATILYQLSVDFGLVNIREQIVDSYVVDGVQGIHDIVMEYAKKFAVRGNE
ncbi:MAG TPA: hypothetical protein VD735_06455 [Candidatus Saccharimonadales bacterium]|nr:hypothetical protein [Candidatus Saccharimonadales bacterium]